MSIFNRTNLKLLIVSFSFTIIFGICCTIMIQYVLKTNMKLVCDVYYQQISSKMRNDILLLKSANEYLAKNEVIVNYISDNDKEHLYNDSRKQDVLKEIQNIQKILKAVSFVDTINIVDLNHNYLFSKGREIPYFNVEKRPWYDEEFLNSYSEHSKLTKKHIDFSTGKSTISILSLIYPDVSEQQKISQKANGVAILDIYVEDLLNSINRAFYSGTLETEIYSDYTVMMADLENYKNDYNIYINRNILNNGEYLVFRFEKNSLVTAPVTENSLEKMSNVLWGVSIVISILLFISIRICFRSALVSINKLKLILEKLNSSDGYFDVNSKNEFKQLEILADTLNKSFDNKIQELIYYDDLTKLPNRKMLEYICNKLIENNESFALIFIDLNKFKYINDVFGHTVGDEYLVKFSSIMKDAIEDNGVLTRHSGDEFILIYNKYVDDETLLNFYNDKIIKAFSQPIKINSELTTEIGFSAGVSTYPKDASNFEELISKSDFMMYINKKNFVNRKIAFFNKEIYSELLYIEKIKSELKLALEKNEFYLNYQPIIDKKLNIVKVEVLIRWNNDSLGFVPPDKFIKYLEETRQVVPIGYWIIDVVCKEVKNLIYKGNQVQININISPIQLMLKDFVSNVKDIIEKYDLDYKCLCFEITENVLLENKPFVLNNIEELRNLGIKIALDDFGTGYSSFNYLRNYKIDILKIDKSFLIDNEKIEFDIIAQIKELAHLLKMEVVMEGVETKEQFEAITNMNIDYLQGYYFSKPISLEEFKNMLNG